MRLLLDTHAFLWAVSDPEALRDEARAAIEDPQNHVFVSAVSGWEISIRKAKGLLEVPDGLGSAITAQFEHLPLTFDQAERSASLPTHHRDPLTGCWLRRRRASG